MLLDDIFNLYIDKDGHTVHNVLDENDKATEVTDFWSLTSLFALAVRACSAYGGKYYKIAEQVINAMSYYRGCRSDNEYGKKYYVYAVHRGSEPNACDVYGDHGEESVFDDQIWVAQEFLNLYNLTENDEYLTEAKNLTDYIYDVGYDKYIGGIYWGQAYTSRHACSSAPFVKLAVMLGIATGDKGYIDKAKNVYSFCYNELKDSDDLYFDLVRTVYDGKDYWQGGKSIKSGDVDYKKYSYNSGSMISAGVWLYKATGEEKYLRNAELTAKSARDYFGKTNVKQGFTVYPGSDGNTTYSWFNLILFKGYYDLFTVDNSYRYLLEEVKKTISFDKENYSIKGFFPTSGLIGWTSGRNTYQTRVLMDHVTNADTLLLVEKF